MLKFSLVICTRKRPVLLARCLSAVAHLNPAPSRVIVVDNTDGDEETKMAAAQFGARYVVEPRAGFGRARKRGLAECETDAVAYLEDDAIPDSDWLNALLASSARQKASESKGKVVDIASSGRSGDGERSRKRNEGK